ncbi:hypothetical protein SEA_LILMARTIN_122 [Streptomyces phage LilMartin]|nr:hypothetical protein SEA_LILMARTIN_122 [Streptomyces phage LilMartin]QNO12536.1 hypothetical protein SEA_MULCHMANSION_122 [Streptomyces phage MulchMansion]UVK61207.1 hypothetical protein SEA_ANGELA_123 [Streptomyces phage Angela]
MKNWLGHKIEVGAVVFRGGKQGTSSSFRVGVVDAIDEDKRTARVEWHWVPSNRTIWDTDRYDYSYQDDNRYYVSGPAKASTQRTRYHINDLARLDDGMLEYLEKRYRLIEAAIHYKIQEADFARFEQDFYAGFIPDII